MIVPVVLSTDLPNLRNRGKVRDIYDLGSRLMIVASDRISAFDVVMDQPVPGKGRLLTQLTRFWLDTLTACRPHHLDYVVERDRVPAGYERHVALLDGRAMVVHKADVLPVECVVRGYLAGSGWKEYQQRGSICGVKLPPGLRSADRLPEPIFTPSTKAACGHDEPISFSNVCEIVGCETASLLRDRSIAIYQQAAEFARRRGIILADTKFEFGRLGNEVILIDEVLTPDSSRFWPQEEYQPGANPPSFDKQFLRDYLDSLDWPKRPPPPHVPDDILRKTADRYCLAYRRITGKSNP